MNPFSGTYDLKDDMLTVREAQEGSQKALEKLVRTHQRIHLQCCPEVNS